MKNCCLRTGRLLTTGLAFLGLVLAFTGLATLHHSCRNFQSSGTCENYFRSYWWSIMFQMLVFGCIGVLVVFERVEKQRIVVLAFLVMVSVRLMWDVDALLAVRNFGSKLDKLDDELRPKVIAEYNRGSEDYSFVPWDSSPVATLLENAIKAGHHALATDGFASLDAYDKSESSTSHIYLLGLVLMTIMDFVLVVAVGLSGKNTSIN